MAAPTTVMAAPTTHLAAPKTLMAAPTNVIQQFAHHRVELGVLARAPHVRVAAQRQGKQWAARRGAGQRASIGAVGR